MKNTYYKYRMLYWALLLLILLTSCKDEWLDAKPNKALVVPKTIENFRALLDNTTYFNTDLGSILGEVGAADFYVSDEVWNSLASALERNIYYWKRDNLQEGEPNIDWSSGYETILYSNIILEGIAKISVDERDMAYKNVKGAALFYRAFAYFNLAQLFCNPYDASTASEDPGLPLRERANVNVVTKRSSVQETYEMVIKDLTAAHELLLKSPLYKTRPGKSAATGLLACVFLTMEKYDLALQYAENYLTEHDELINFNDLDTTSNYPISLFNEEVVFHSSDRPTQSLSNSRHIVNDELYNSYRPGDLRRSVFFRLDDGYVRFRGSYNGSRSFFTGIATDEMYLIKAECLARSGNATDAMKTLNELLITRWKEGLFIPYSADQPLDALTIILNERRKELISRGRRWSDLRRLNKDERFADTLIRVLNGEVYTLLPNDLRYTFPIPDEEILLNPVEQNPR